MLEYGLRRATTITMNKDFPFTLEDFKAIYSKVPRLSVELIVKDKNNKIYLTKRAIPPCEGQWHIPGGTVFFGESLFEAVKRIGKREIGISVNNVKDNGYIEYPSHYLHGLDSPVGIVFEVTDYTGEATPNDEAEAGGWFSELPKPFHADQDNYLINKGYIGK